MRGPLRGYGPALALATAFALMVILVPSKAGTAHTGLASPPTPTAPASTAPRVAGMPVTGRTAICPHQLVQIPGDAYSPLCIQWNGGNPPTGANGGATTPGVTGDTITVAYRSTADGNYVSLIEQLLAVNDPDFKPDKPADLLRTTEGLVDYFNRHFQFYGRKIKLVPYQAQGSAVAELFGSGQAGATADAVHVATSIHAFADLTATTTPYGDALARRGVLALGAPYVSDHWLVEHRPYAWSMTPSCSFVSTATDEFDQAVLLGKPAAYAGGSLRGQPRKLAIIAPDNPEYQRCVRDGLTALGPAGRDVVTQSYSLNLSQLANEATSIITKLKANGVTTVACACDTTMPTYLTKRATQQNYYPEWNIEGTALIDSDAAGQLYDQTQWAHAFGTSALGIQPAFDTSPGVKAYRSVRSDRPAHVTESLYDQLYQLAIGIEMAGPDLTPVTFEQGMFAYPERTGVDGTWKWGPGKYTPQVDAQVIWWDPNRTSLSNGRLGGYVAAGPRYSVGTLASHPLSLFTPP